MDRRHADVVDELLLHEQPRIPDGVEHLADGQRRRGVLADEPEALLVLGGHSVFEPEQPCEFQILAETGGLDRRQAVMRIVQELDIPAMRLRTALKSSGT